MSFANALRSKAKEAEEVDREKLHRQALKANWRIFEERVLDEALRVFKGRCLREAELARSEATVSFENISRELVSFPKHVKENRNYWVHDWLNSSQEEWHYAKQGEKNSYVPGARTPASELLGSMIGRFVDKVGSVGYSHCSRVPGTWKVAVAWNFDGGNDEEIDEDSSEQDQDMDDATPDKQSSQMQFDQENKEEEATEEKNDEAMSEKREEELTEEKKEEEATEEKTEGATEEKKEPTEEQRIDPDAEQKDKDTTENEEKKGEAHDEKVEDEDEPKEDKEFEAKASQEGENNGDANGAAKHDGVENKAGAVNGHSAPAVKRPARTGEQRREQRREAKLDSLDFILVLQKSTRKSKNARGQRDSLVDNWNGFQETLLRKAVDTFKERCKQEAELGKSEAQISFEGLSKDMAGFPKRRRDGQKYYVDSWGDSTAEDWHYATKGVDVDFLDRPVLFSELLEGMLVNFLDKAKHLGFPSCKRIAGSWKVSVRWDGDAGGVFNPESGFVKSLRVRCQLASKVRRQRMKAGAKYKLWVDQTLEASIDMLKEECKNAAAMRKRSTTSAFDVLTRDVSGFPTRIKTSGMYLVDSWGTCSAEHWFYATHGIEQAYVATKPVSFPELLESMMPRFVTRVSEVGFDSCERVPRTWKVAVRWAQDAVPLEQEKSLAFGFGAALRAKVKEAEKATAKREKLAGRWKKLEERLMSKAVKLLKNRCLKEAENGKRDAIISFEAITREVGGFPKHDKQEEGYVVKSWGKSSAEEWFYANQGINDAFDKSSPPVLAAELLAGMIGRFLEKAAHLGFSSCDRMPGTWKVLVKWGAEGGDDSGTKRAEEGEHGDASGAKKQKVNEEGEAGNDSGTQRAADEHLFWPDGTKKRRVQEALRG